METTIKGISGGFEIDQRLTYIVPWLLLLDTCTFNRVSVPGAFIDLD